MNPNEVELFGGLSGVELLTDPFDLGEGVMVSQTYAHVMAHFIAAFERAEPGKPHPAPWKNLRGGFAYDIVGELRVPRELDTDRSLDRLNTLWLLTMLLRLRAGTAAHMPVVASRAFAEIAAADEETEFWNVEMTPWRQVPDSKWPARVNDGDLVWIRENWREAGRLYRDEKRFAIAMRLSDRAVFANTPEFSLLAVWGALEAVFSLWSTEVTYRVSTAIASFLEPPGAARFELAKQIVRMYGIRSKAAHGQTDDVAESLPEAFALLRRVLVRMIASREVPDRNRLGRLMMGMTLSEDVVM